MLIVSQSLHRTWHLLENFAASFCALNFIGGVRFVQDLTTPNPLFFTLFLDLHSSWVYSLVAQLQYGACVNTWSGRLAFRIKKPDECVLTAQVFLPDNNGLYVHHRRRPRRNLLCIAPERFHLHMGRRKCWTKVRPVFWFCCCLVVDHGLDDVYCRQLSSKGNLVSWLRSILTRD